ncbi:MAG: amidophosphoribosyltransferase [Archaeoglobi archaeon]|nr:amidophosphoribosyltransferase [Candidatus Mnemosynella sp.]MBC7114850.1 amidophosphoribosyltransferase [Candidatus Mnemosynella bozhongmuii]
MREECGVVGVFSRDSEDVAPHIYYALFSLQHRGQESAGIATFDGSKIRIHKSMGLVSEVFSEEKLRLLKGDRGIGHVRYSTTGASVPENSQPLSISFRGGTIAIAHNGNIVNSLELRRALEEEGHVFISESDTEVIAHLLAKELLKKDVIDASKEVMRRLTGAYSLTILVNDMLVALRDPNGFKPLCLGEVDGSYIVASESVAIDVLGGKLIRDISPGELLIIGDELESHQLVRNPFPSLCVFEFVYFARPDSIIEGKLVYDVRRRIGERLYQEYGIEGDIVCAVPDSGVTSAIGYSLASGIPFIEGLIKNRYVGRTFIMPHQNLREVGVRLKLNVVKRNVENKRVILVDDSIVRGTTSRRIVQMLREAGAKEVHLMVGSPPIIAPCYFGIDMPTREELIAAHKSVEGIKTLIGADSVNYLSLKGLIESVGISERKLCLACLTSQYPVEVPGEVCIRKQARLSYFQHSL